MTWRRQSLVHLLINVSLFLLLAVGVTHAEDYNKTFYVAPDGNDANPGTLEAPWLSMDHALETLQAGDTLYVRGGVYPTMYEGWGFHHSGTASQPITVTNYSGEQAIFRINGVSDNYQAFSCWGRDFKADHVRFIGRDVEPVTLPNGVVSRKGLVILGPDLVNSGLHTTSAGFIVRDCDYWEIAGIDFVDVGYAIFTVKDYANPDLMTSTTHWYVHDNRVYGFYAESGMQFNGDHNRVDTNVISKVHDENFTPWGCQHINLLGYDNVVRNNVLAEEGSDAFCFGIILEWDLADHNIIERNEIYDMDAGIIFLGADNNMIRNNLIVMSVEPNHFIGGITILSTDSNYVEYCNSEPAQIIPPDDPTHPEYAHYYTPRNCHSYGNAIYNNTVYGYYESIRFYDVVPDATIIQNNVLAEWRRGAICNYNAALARCMRLPDSVNVMSNRTSGDMVFRDIMGFDFSPGQDSPLIDGGIDLSGLVDEDIKGNVRPQGQGYDIGAYEVPAVSSLVIESQGGERLLQGGDIQSGKAYLNVVR